MCAVWFLFFPLLRGPGPLAVGVCLSVCLLLFLSPASFTHPFSEARYAASSPWATHSPERLRVDSGVGAVFWPLSFLSFGSVSCLAFLYNGDTTPVLSPFLRFTGPFYSVFFFPLLFPQISTELTDTALGTGSCYPWIRRRNSLFILFCLAGLGWFVRRGWHCRHFFFLFYSSFVSLRRGNSGGHCHACEGIIMGRVVSELSGPFAESKKTSLVASGIAAACLTEWAGGWSGASLAARVWFPGAGDPKAVCISLVG
jgi:hypothetical protein